MHRTLTIITLMGLTFTGCSNPLASLTPTTSTSSTNIKKSYQKATPAKQTAYNNTMRKVASGIKNDPNYNKSTFIERIKYRGYHFSRAAENITVGNATNTAEKAIERWLNSEGHCKNLMSDQFTEVGMAYVDDENTFHQYYWVQEFGYPQ